MRNNYRLVKKNPLETTKGIFYLKYMLLSIIIFSFICLSAQPKIEFKVTKKNFGFVKRGTVVTIDYEFLNIGNEPLIINDAEVSCSCTSVNYPTQPISPNQSAKITVNFNTNTVYDRQDRIVIIRSNDPKTPAKIRYKGIVSRK